MYIHIYIYIYIYTSIHIIGMYVYICIWVYLQEIWFKTSTCFIVPAVQDEDATCCLWGKGLETTPTTCFSRWNFRRLLKFQLVDEVVDELCWILHVITFVWKSFALIQCWLNWHVVVFKRNRVPDFTRLSFFCGKMQYFGIHPILRHIQTSYQFVFWYLYDMQRHTHYYVPCIITL